MGLRCLWWVRGKREVTDAVRASPALPTPLAHFLGENMQAGRGGGGKRGGIGESYAAGKEGARSRKLGN